MEPTITTEQAAQRLGVDIDTVRRYLRSGRLRGYQLSRKTGWRIFEDSIEQMISASIEKSGRRQKESR